MWHRGGFFFFSQKQRVDLQRQKAPCPDSPTRMLGRSQRVVSDGCQHRWGQGDLGFPLCLPPAHCQRGVTELEELI